MVKDPYPDYMRESINKVEKTREKRLKETMAHCSPDEIDDVLNKFHPDFIKEQKHALRFGVSKGEVVPLEVAKIVETKSVNLVDSSGVARFPDAPTNRGVKHLRTLINLKSPGVQPWIVFIVMRQDAIAFHPFIERDSQFAEALRCAKDAGVKILVLKFKASFHSMEPPGVSMYYQSKLDVLLDGRSFPGFWPVTQ